MREPGHRFENFVACHLLKWAHFREDTEGYDVELRYFRDVDKREVDFVIVEDRKPTLFLECKLSDEPPSPALLYLSARFPKVRAVQIACSGKRRAVHASGIELEPALDFLKTLA